MTGSATHRANTVMTCDAPGFTISGNTFEAKCYPMIAGSFALRVRGNNCVVQNNTFKNPVENGYIVDNKVSGLAGSSGVTAAVTYSSNIIDMTSATKTSGHTIVENSYAKTPGSVIGGLTYVINASSTDVLKRYCWVISGFEPTTAALVCIGLSKVIESDKETDLVFSASAVLGSVNYTTSTPAAQEQAQAAIKDAVTTALTAAGSAAPAKAIELVTTANSNFTSNNNAVVEKSGVAAGLENSSSVVLTSTQATSLFAAIAPENVASDLIANKEVELVPAKSVVVGGVTTRYIIKPAEAETVIRYTPMIAGEWYNLLLDSEVVAGVPTPTVGATISQLRYALDTADNKYKIFHRASPTSSAVVVPLGSEYTIVRNGNVYPYRLFSIGGIMDGSDTIPCIPAGQRILTAAGWRAVEELRNGDMVITDTGAAVPAKIYSSTVITTSKTAPINIPASMFGKTGAPVRLSPLHAVRLSKGIWEFPYNLLRSREGVTQDAPGASVTYYHIALPNFLRDNMVLEGGVVAESYGAPFVKANGLKGVKLYTYSERLGGYTRMAPGAVTGKSKSA
jgi:hypothetical protein